MPIENPDAKHIKKGEEDDTWSNDNNSITLHIKL
jgi:hypothetical protein